MRKSLLLAAGLALSTVAVAPAHSTVTVPITLDDGAGGFIVTVTGSFSYDFTFTLPASGLLTGSLTSSAVTDPIAFSVVTLNGTALSKDPMSNSYSLLSPIDAWAGPQVFHVEGTGSSQTTGFSGTVQFIGSVPEPAAWSLMVIGFGALGFTMRRRTIEGAAARI